MKLFGSRWPACAADDGDDGDDASAAAAAAGDDHHDRRHDSDIGVESSPQEGVA